MNYPPAHTLLVIATFGLSFGVHLCQAEEPLAAGFKHSSWVTDPEPRQQEQIRSFLLGISFHEGYFPIRGSSWRVFGTFIRAANAGGAVGPLFLPPDHPSPCDPTPGSCCFSWDFTTAWQGRKSCTSCKPPPGLCGSSAPSELLFPGSW